jgi:hypothetical protein
LRPAHARRHLYVTCYTEGSSHFVTSMTAPVASGWSVRQVGLAPTGKRRLLTAHTLSGHTGPAALGVAVGRKARLRRSPREGPELASKPSFHASAKWPSPPEADVRCPLKDSDSVLTHPPAESSQSAALRAPPDRQKRTPQQPRRRIAEANDARSCPFSLPSFPRSPGRVPAAKSREPNASVRSRLRAFPLGARGRVRDRRVK